MKVAIIGGGACGLILASKLANINNIQVEIIEINSRVGKKILQTGNGRCNFSNANIQSNCYNNPKFIEKLPKVDVFNYFKSIGLYYYLDEENRAYPISDNANSILDVLRNSYINSSNVIEKTGLVTTDIIKEKEGYKLCFNDGTIAIYDYVIVCIGSMIANSTYNNNLLKNLNLKSKPFQASLCPLKVDVKGLAGVKVKAELFVYNGTKQIYHEKHCEVLFKENGLSGIGIFNASSVLNYHKKTGQQIIKLNLLPSISFDELLNDLLNRKNNNPNSEVNNIFVGMLNKMLALHILSRCNIKNTILNSQVNEVQIRQIVEKILNLTYPIDGHYSLINGQVGHGGINVNQVNPLNLEVINHPSLYLGGEMLDIDGLCGGFNLNFAFSCGLIIANDIIAKNKY